MTNKAQDCVDCRGVPLAVLCLASSFLAHAKKAEKEQMLWFYDQLVVNWGPQLDLLQRHRHDGSQNIDEIVRSIIREGDFSRESLVRHLEACIETLRTLVFEKKPT